MTDLVPAQQTPLQAAAMYGALTGAGWSAINLLFFGGRRLGTVALVGAAWGGALGYYGATRNAYTL